MNLVRNILILLILCGIVLGDNVIWEDEIFSAHNTWDFGTNAVRGKNLYFVNIDGTTLTDGIATLTGGDWTAIDDLTMGSATVNTGVFSMIQGGVASDPTFSITLAGDNAYIDQTIGDLYLASDGTIFFDNPLYTNQIATFGGTTVDYLLDLGDMDIGTITVNGGNFQMTQGAVAGDPTFTITQSGNNVVINQTIGDMTISTGSGEIDFDGDNLSDIGTLTATTFTDGTFSITAGVGTGIVSLDGADLDITAGTGDWSTTGTNQFGRAGINGVPVTKSMLKIYQSGDGGANHDSFVSGLSIYGHDDRSDDVLTLYVDQYGQPVIWGKESITIATGAGTHTNAREIFGWTAFNLDGVPTERTRFNVSGDFPVTFFESSISGENAWIRQYGWITADPAKKWIAWTVNDTDDTFQLTREDSFITAFDIVMPVTIGDGTNEMQVSSTGDTSWAGTGGLLYGNMDQENATSFTVTLTNQNDWYELDHATTGISAGELNDVTFDGDHYLKGRTAGMYFIIYSLVCSVNDTNQHIEFQILKNDNVTGKGESHTTFIASSRDLSCGSNTILDLAVDDEISIAARNVTVAGKIITIDHLEMTIFLIGGT